MNTPVSKERAQLPLQGNTQAPDTFMELLQGDTTGVRSDALSARLRDLGCGPQLMAACQSLQILVHEIYPEFTAILCESVADTRENCRRLNPKESGSVYYNLRDFGFETAAIDWEVAQLVMSAVIQSAGAFVSRARDIIGFALTTDPGLYLLSIGEGLVEGASFIASKGHTCGYDCAFQSLSLLTGIPVTEVGERLSLVTSHYRAENHAGLWITGRHINDLGFQYQRLGSVYTTTDGDQVKSWPQQVGFWRGEQDPIQSVVKELMKFEQGAKFLVLSSDHAFCAVKDGDRVRFLDRQTVSGRTIEIPLEILAAQQFSSLTVTRIIDATGLKQPALSEIFEPASAEHFILESPWAWGQKWLEFSR